MAKTQLKLKFDHNLDFQLKAIRAVVDVFEGLPRHDTAFTLGGGTVPNLPESEWLSESWLLENVIAVQERQKIHPIAELAEMETATGNLDEAYRLFCQALSEPQKDQFKLGIFEKFAALALKMRQPETARLHLALARAVRIENGWEKIPESLSRLESETMKALEASGKEPEALPDTTKALSQMAKKVWQDGCLAGKERFRGRVKA